MRNNPIIFLKMDNLMMTRISCNKCFKNKDLKILSSWLKKYELLINFQPNYCKLNLAKFKNLRKQNLKEFLNSKKRREVVKDSLKCKHGCLLSCMFRPSFSEMIKNGPRQFIKLVKSK